MATIQIKQINSGTITGVSTGAFVPGELAEKTTSGLYQRHSAADGAAMKLICLPQPEEPDIEVEITTGSDILMWPVMTAEVFNARLAIGNVTAIGDILVSDGTGKLKKPTGTPTNDGAIIGRAYSIADATSAVVRVRVEAM